MSVPVIVHEELLGRGRLHLSDFLADGRGLHVSKHDRVVPIEVRDFGSIGLAMGIGVVRDSVARRAFRSTKFVYTRGNGMFWPPEEYLLPRALPPEWISGMRGATEEEAAERLLELAAAGVRDDASADEESESHSSLRSGSQAADMLSQAMGLHSSNNRTSVGESKGSGASEASGYRASEVGGPVRDSRSTSSRNSLRISAKKNSPPSSFPGPMIRRASISHSPTVRAKLYTPFAHEATGISDDTGADDDLAHAMPRRSSSRPLSSRRTSVDAALNLAASRALRSHASPHLSDRHKLEQKLPLQTLVVGHSAGSVRLESNRGHLVSLTAGAAASIAPSARDEDFDRRSQTSARSRSSRTSRGRRPSLVAPMVGDSTVLKSPPSQL